LVDNVLILVPVLLDDLVEDCDELAVLSKGIGRRRDGGGGANGKSLQRWVVVEVCEDV
jgi:hypothetical protein